MERKEQEKILREKNKRRKKELNVALTVFLLVSIIGYLFFFTSKLWLGSPDMSDKCTPYGIKQTVNEKHFTLIDWFYNKHDKEMEVVIKYQDYSGDDINSFDVLCLDKNRGKLNIDTMVETDDLIVIKINNVPRNWSIIGVRINAPKNSDSKFSGILFTMAKDKIEYTDEPIKKRSIQEYENLCYLREIDVCNKKIEKSNKKIKTCSDENDRFLNTINKIENDKKSKLYNSEEMLEAEKNIRELTEKRKENNQTIKKNETNIKRNKEKIKELKKAMR